MNTYKQLRVWKQGIEIVEFVYKISKKFPPEEKFGLAVQMQRAAISIPSNIAEGHDRGYRKEFQRFCQIALGSCAELTTQLIIAHRQEYVSRGEFELLEKCLQYEGRMLMRLIKSLSRKS